MTIRGLLRTAAFLIAGAAVIDPAVPTTASAPVPVSLRATGDATASQVREVREQLESSLKFAVNFDPVGSPAATVLVGNRPEPGFVSDDVPVSTISSARPRSPNVRIASASDPSPVIAGWSAIVDVVIEGSGVAGRTTEVVLEQNGVETSRVSHAWTKEDERFATRLTCPFTAPGVAMLAVRAKPTAGETTLDDNAVDLRGVAESRVLRVAAYDPRPSWTSAFVRRVLEADPMFEVSTIVKASKDVDVRTGHPPGRITVDAFEPYDLIVVGAPEELTAGESDALSSFGRERGGAVLLLPDRRPSGAYLGLVGASGFDEVLLDKPVELESRGAGQLRGSEFALPKGTEAVSILAAIRQGESSRPVVVSVPAGRGQIMFSGALDAWRFRGADDEGYARFWRQLVALAAMAAPRRLELSLHPGIATPGTPITVRADVRRTEVEQQGANRRSDPAISATVIAANGSTTPVRLWPTAEAGVYEGRFDAAAAGRYDVRASLDSRVTADSPLVISDTARMLHARDDEGLQLVARTTGGVAVTGDALGPLEASLGALHRPAIRTSFPVMRSPWWMVAFVALLCAEWTERRRRGNR